MKPDEFFRHMKISSKTFVFQCAELARKYSELIKYGIFGVLTTIIDFGVYTILYEMLSVNGTLSNAIAWFAAVVFAFITNKLFVFESRSRSFSRIAYEFATFFAARAFTGAVYIGGYALLIEMGVNGYIAKALLSIFNIIVNYIFSKLITFRKRKAPENIEAMKENDNAPRVRNGAIMIGAFDKQKAEAPYTERDKLCSENGSGADASVISEEHEKKQNEA